MRYRPRYNLKREYENKINEFRVEKGLSLNMLAKKTGLRSQSIWSISQGYSGPIDRNGKVKKWAEALCNALDCDLSELFPYELCTHPKTKLVTKDQLNSATLSDYTCAMAENMTRRKLEYKQMKDLLLMLRCNERTVIEYYYGVNGHCEMSLRDVGNILTCGCSLHPSSRCPDASTPAIPCRP